MVEIPLTQGQVALIDDEDYGLVSQHNWFAQWNPATKSFYAMTHIRKLNGRQTTLYMHRLLKDARKGEQVDHIHHNTLDNRQEETRLCTGSQNMHNTNAYANNTSGYKGVTWHPGAQKYQARIMLNRKNHNLGLFATAELAHKARCKAALEMHGEFANHGNVKEKQNVPVMV